MATTKKPSPRSSSAKKQPARSGRVDTKTTVLVVSIALLVFAVGFLGYAIGQRSQASAQAASVSGMTKFYSKDGVDFYACRQGNTLIKGVMKVVSIKSQAYGYMRGSWVWTDSKNIENNGQAYGGNYYKGAAVQVTMGGLKASTTVRMKYTLQGNGERYTSATTSGLKLGNVRSC